MNTTVSSPTATGEKPSSPGSGCQNDCFRWTALTIIRKRCRTNEEQSHLGRTSHLATGVDAAKSSSVTQCCHLLGKLGLCTVTSASVKPTMIKNVVITNGHLLFVLNRGDIARGQHQPKLINTFPSLPQYCQWLSNTPLVLKHKLRISLTTSARGQIHGNNPNPSRKGVPWHLIYLTSCQTGCVQPQCPFIVKPIALPWHHFPEGIYCYIHLLLQLWRSMKVT